MNKNITIIALIALCSLIMFCCYNQYLEFEEINDKYVETGNQLNECMESQNKVHNL